MLPILLFPFAIRRSDDTQGLWARQLSFQLSQELTSAGLDARYVPMVARAEGTLHWFPRTEPWTRQDASQLLDTREDALLLLGSSRVQDAQVSLQIKVIRASDGRHVVDASGQGGLAQAFEALGEVRDALLTALGNAPLERPPACQRWANDPDARLALFADADADLLDQLDGDPWRQADPFALLRRALDAEPECQHAIGTWLARGIRIAGRGKLRVALAGFDELLSRSSAHRDIWCARAEALSKAKHFEAAEDAYRHTLTLDPTFAYPYFRLGYLRLLVEDWTSAEHYLAEALKRDPDQHAIRNQLAIARAELGKLEEAQALWNEVLADDAASADARRLAETSKAVASARVQ